MQTFQHFLLQFEDSGKNASMPVQVNSHVLVRALVFENLYKTVFSVGTEFFFPVRSHLAALGGGARRIFVV